MTNSALGAHWIGTMDSLLLVLLITLSAIALVTAAATFAFFTLASALPRLRKGVVAFFHPFADGGGGGERVLWCAVKAVQDASPTSQVAIYVREGVTAEQLVADAMSRFNIRIEKPIQVIPLRRTHLVQPERYPRFTLLRQALGSVGLGLEALRQLVPEVYIDTTGWAFPYPFAWWAGSRVVAYVHYPTISSDMLGRVWSGTATYNNDADIAESPVKTAVKLLYYHAVALWYGMCGCVTAVTCVNSSWTRDHIQRMWFTRRPPLLVYPPVDTSELLQLPLDRKLKQLYLVSVNQFRPEKNHRLQLEAFALAKRGAGPTLQGQAVREAKLKFIGGCRHADDRARLEALQRYAQELGLEGCVEWIVNAPFSELKLLLGGAVGGLHTMTDEHFGISVVEYMAAGVVPIAHNSAGPRQDIVRPVLDDEGCEQVTGFLATTAEEFAEAITRVLTMDQRERLKIAAAAQRQATRFSTERFLQDFNAAVAPVMPR
ncbi:hypothetical protein PLESTB_000810100 [Pleodorina starrii]|uniref:GDP-Man:Man(3)GlcNAc(2)-PP-Dol alpha-1,2-mannosyltransferase n=1 Tax=Pleodorina starrii TaxID=330485 RepID=A0A9W6F364_9CHLO|nr:hypothetical protein PLESTM_000914700 [Pleodorina starrii]GLC53971.1 hypothetical protein PLESTB_000810100 [Pleodorina starrii]GLC70254.1 hypothetical protein PLESTF_000948700 [Pleodorina starrii]